MTLQVCNSTSHDLNAETTLKTQIADNLVIAPRFDDNYEACYWIVSVEENKFRDDTDGYIELQIEKLDNAVAYIYDGTGRNNATAFVENNQTAVVGAPFRAPISSKLIVVIMTAP